MTESKLKEIEELSLRGPRSVSRLIVLSQDDDEEVRFRAIEALAAAPRNGESELAVKGALSDPDGLVRTAAVEALGFWKPTGADLLLTEAIDDPDPLVRSAAMIGLGSIGSKRSIWTLERKYRSQSCESADRLSCTIALYSLGRSSNLDAALNFLGHDCYRLRSAAANLLREFVSTNDIPRVLERLRESIRYEKTEAAKSSMRNAIEDLSTPA